MGHFHSAWPGGNPGAQDLAPSMHWCVLGRWDGPAVGKGLHTGGFWRAEVLGRWSASTAWRHSAKHTGYLQSQTVHFPSYLSALKQSCISWDLKAAQMSKPPPCLPQLAACSNGQRRSAWKPSLCQMGFIFLEESLNSHYSWFFFFDFSDFYQTWSLSATSHWKEEWKHTAGDVNFINFVGSATYRLKNPELLLGSCTARP